MKLFAKLKRMWGRDLNCADANSFLASYVDGELEPEVETKFKTHINRCPNCATFLDQYETTVDLCRSSRIDDVPAELVAETLSFLRKNW
jgi:anti-sigma factor RsiW